MRKDQRSSILPFASHWNNRLCFNITPSFDSLKVQEMFLIVERGRNSRKDNLLFFLFLFYCIRCEEFAGKENVWQKKSLKMITAGRHICRMLSVVQIIIINQCKLDQRLAYITLSIHNKRTAVLMPSKGSFTRVLSLYNNCKGSGGLLFPTRTHSWIQTQVTKFTLQRFYVCMPHGTFLQRD